MMKLIEKTIFDISGKRDITPDTDFILDLSLNSLDMMNMICTFEDELEIEIPTQDVRDLHLVKDLVSYLENRAATYSKLP